MNKDLQDVLFSILNNLSYFSESIAKIENVNERYVLLNQFTQDEIHLRPFKYQLK